MEEYHLIRLEPLDQSAHLRVASAEPDDGDDEIVEVAQKRGRADKVVEVLSVADVPRMHNDEPVDEILGARPVGLTRPWLYRGGIDPVRDDSDVVRRAPFSNEALRHPLTDRDNVVGSPQVIPHERAQHPHEHWFVRPTQLGGDFREDILADNEQRGAVPPSDHEREVADDRRIGHANDELRRRKPSSERLSPRYVR